MNKKIAFLIILLSATLFSCSSRYVQDDISCLQIVDRNGLSETISSEEKLNKYKNVDFDGSQSYQNVLRIYKKDLNGDVLSKRTSYHDNGQVWKYLEIKNARAYGKYKEFYPNGALKIDAYVIGGSADFSMKDEWLFDGHSKVYDQKEILIADYNYEKGSLEGDTTYYYPTSQIKKLEPYLNNEIHGEVIEYAKDGSYQLKSSYKNGIKHGSTIGFWSPENISYMEDYDNDLIINAQYFQKSRVKISSIKNGDGQRAIFKDGILYQLVEYKNGKAEGKVQTFLPNGDLVNEIFQKNNLKNGEEIQYYTRNEIHRAFKSTQPHKKLEISWDNGKIHGMVRTWYKNSKLESQKEYSQNKKCGCHFAWYEKGGIMFIEEYENDALIKGSYYKIAQKDPLSSVINGNGTATLFDSKGRFIKKVTYKEGHPNQ